MPAMLRPPSLGPIVGHTTSDSVRLWMRGADQEGRSIGLVALFDQAGKAIPGKLAYFRLRREYDRTGVIDLGALKADTLYHARMASLTIDSVDADITLADAEVFSKLPKPQVWLDELCKLSDEQSLATFRTRRQATATTLSFIFGSCRYPGLFFSTKKADRIFGAIFNQFQSDASLKFLLMVGDQIYADKLNRSIPLARADSPSEFHDRYLTAFSSPNMRHLLRSVPTYMILDDHEIEDNWVRGRIKNTAKRELFQMAISAYMSYQWLHSPRNYGPQGELDDASGDYLYYSFDCEGDPVFVMDSRTQRIKDDDDTVLEDNHLLGYPAKASAVGYLGQIDLLCQWLVDQQAQSGNRPKFIVSPSVFVPNTVRTAGNTAKSLKNKCEDDSWAAFPQTRRQLLETIVKHNIQNVVFLSGDVHCSNIAEMRFVDSKTRSDLPLRAYSITSSTFYWPWSFADGDPLSFVHDSSLEQDNFKINSAVEMAYKATHFEQSDNFTRVDVMADRINIRNFDKDGQPLGKIETIALVV